MVASSGAERISASPEEEIRVRSDVPAPGARHGYGMTTSLRRTAGTALITTALLATGGTAALAAPTASSGCSQVLARATQWPGTMQLHGQTYRIYSDSYYSSLLASPACRTPGA